MKSQTPYVDSLKSAGYDECGLELVDIGDGWKMHKIVAENIELKWDKLFGKEIQR